MMDAISDTICNGGQAIRQKQGKKYNYINYLVILMIRIKPSICAFGQPLRKRSLTSDRAYSMIPHRRRGKRHHHGGDVCWLVVLGVDGTLVLFLPTVRIIRGESFSFPPEPKCESFLFARTQKVVKLLTTMHQNYDIVLNARIFGKSQIHQ
jgi:hypothetical protein